MGEERLTNLALLHIHYDVKIDLDDVTELFIKKHPRRMELDSILKEYRQVFNEHLKPAFSAFKAMIHKVFFCLFYVLVLVIFVE